MDHNSSESSEEESRQEASASSSEEQRQRTEDAKDLGHIPVETMDRDHGCEIEHPEPAPANEGPGIVATMTAKGSMFGF